MKQKGLNMDGGRWEWEGGPPMPPDPVWYWSVFGRVRMEGGRKIHLVMLTLNFEVPWWRRLVTRVLLGSEWKRV